MLNEAPIVDLINRRFDDLRHDVSRLRDELSKERADIHTRLSALEKAHFKLAGGVTVVVFILQFLYDKFVT